MKILLDTHVWLWSISQPDRLGPGANQLLASLSTQVYLSAVSSWEITIKWRLGKLKLPGRPDALVQDSLTTNNFLSLDISHRHSCAVGDLPAHHGDPFDRLLVAQAVTEKLVFLTADKPLLAYPVSTFWAFD